MSRLAVGDQVKVTVGNWTGYTGTVHEISEPLYYIKLHNSAQNIFPFLLRAIEFPPSRDDQGRFESPALDFSMEAVNAQPTLKTTKQPDALNQNHERNKLGVKMAYINQYPRKP